MCGIGIIHHHDSEFHSSQLQFNTILTEIPPLKLTKNESDSNSHCSQSQNRSLIRTPEYESSESFSCRTNVGL